MIQANVTMCVRVRFKEKENNRHAVGSNREGTAMARWQVTARWS